MKILVVIPAYNEATVIARIVREVSGLYPVVVINDGSTDETALAADNAGAVVLNHTINRGLGAALRTGFAYAAERGYDAVVTIDADGQHNPAEIPRLVSTLIAGAHDMVVGVRIARDMPFIRRVYNAIGRALTWFLFGTGGEDSQSGLRVLRTALISKMRLRASRMEISSELIAEAHRLRCSVATVPIQVTYTEYSLSKGQNFFEGVRTAWRLLLRSLSV